MCVLLAVLCFIPHSRKYSMRRESGDTELAIDVNATVNDCVSVSAVMDVEFSMASHQIILDRLQDPVTLRGKRVKTATE